MTFLNLFFNEIYDLHFYFDNSKIIPLKKHITHIPDIFFHRLNLKLSKYTLIGICNPKKILNTILPRLKKECSAKFVAVGTPIKGLEFYKDLKKIDIILTEPICFSEKGICFTHTDIKIIKENNSLACASLIQYTKLIPSTCGIINKGKILCESGTYNIEHAVLEAKQTFPILSNL